MKPLRVRISICTFPGEDSHNVGWIAPYRSTLTVSILTYSSAVHVFPWSVLRSTKVRHCPSSCEAGASQSPLLNTIDLFFTGPRPPRSPGTNSFASLQVSPCSSVYVYHVSQVGTSLPTLKYRITRPSGVVNSTGFQWGSSRSFSSSIGSVQFPGFPFDIQIPTSSSFSAVPPNQATINSPLSMRATVDAWH